MNLREAIAKLEEHDGNEPVRKADLRAILIVVAEEIERVDSSIANKVERTSLADEARGN
jgi:hypothetical protein